MNTNTPTETGEGPSDSLANFTMNQFANRIATLETDLAKALAERDGARASIKLSCEDWADDDTRVKTIAAEFGIRDDDTPGYFQGVIEITDKMADLIRKLTAERDAALAELESLRADLATALRERDEARAEAVSYRESTKAQLTHAIKARALLVVIESDYDHPWLDEDAKTKDHRDWVLSVIRATLKTE